MENHHVILSFLKARNIFRILTALISWSPYLLYVNYDKCIWSLNCNQFENGCIPFVNQSANTDYQTSCFNTFRFCLVFGLQVNGLKKVSSRFSHIIITLDRIEISGRNIL